MGRVNAHDDSASHDDAALMRQLGRLMHRLMAIPDDREPELTGLGLRVAAHLGVDPSGLPITSEEVRPHRLVDTDLAIDEIARADPDAETLGVAGMNRLHDDLAGMLRSAHTNYSLGGPVEYTSAATGPDATRQTVSFALRLLRLDGSPLVVLQRGPAPQFGRETGSLEIVAVDTATAASFVAEMRRLMNQHSVVRGNVVTFTRDEYGNSLGRLTFVPRPHVPADALILPDGVRERIHTHVVGISRQGAQLAAHGQHLKRGVLLYGPPGTGKTLTVRHLLSEAPEATVVLLQGGALGLVGEATRLARTMTPAIVVLEDVDLVAASRDAYGIQPLLFEVLDALDGLDGDADVAFILTTNRADALEPALAARPGRVDLAVEIPLPDAAARRRLFRLYAEALPLSPEVVDACADRAEGSTASFAKELMRRAVLRATLDERSVTDDDLVRALDDLLTSTTGISRVLFGGSEAADLDDAEGSVGFGAHY